MKYLRTRVLPVLMLCLVLAFVFGQDIMTNKVQKESGQTSPVWIWIVIAIIPLLFLVFAIRRANKGKDEIEKDKNKGQRVVDNTVQDNNGL